MGKADPHVHTEYSGFQKLGVIKFPESVVQPDVLVDTARSNGMDVICVTDHDETHGALIAEKYAHQKYDDIQVVVGEEVTSADGEIIGLYLNETIPPRLPVEETVDRIRDQGGLVVAPHPFSFHVPGLKERVIDLDVDALEVINGGHPDGYTNMFARLVVDRWPDRWAETSGSDAHSEHTAGYNWTEFPGTTADDFRKAILEKTTKACGDPAPVFGQVQWSMDVVLGGQRLLYKALKGRLMSVPNDQLIAKINSVSDLSKAAGIIAGFMYMVPPVPFIATIFSTHFLKQGTDRMVPQIPDRLELIERLIREVDSKGGPGVGRPAYLDDPREDPLAQFERMSVIPFSVGRNGGKRNWSATRSRSTSPPGRSPDSWTPWRRSRGRCTRGTGAASPTGA